jgi:hypothetical protein
MTTESIISFVITVVRGALGFLIPKKYAAIPEQVWTVCAEAIPAVVEFVQTLIGLDEVEGAAKHEAVCDAMGEMLDAGFDGLPWWGDIHEIDRDDIIAGIVKTAYHVATAADGGTAIPLPTEVDRPALVAKLKVGMGQPLVALRMARIGGRNLRR